MGDFLELGHGVRIPLSEVDVRVTTSSGPGGQHANRTETRVEVSFDVAASESLTEEQRRLVASRLGPRPGAVAQDTRSQLRNRELALERLRSRLASALAPRKQRRATRPTRASRARRVEKKRRAGDTKRLRRKPRFDD